MPSVITITVPPPEPITVNLTGVPDAPTILDLTPPTAQVITVNLIPPPASPVTIENAEARPGENGQDGENGENGQDGENGASAYLLAVANGFVGSEAAWLASLKGDKGDAGTPAQIVMMTLPNYLALSPATQMDGRWYVIPKT